MARTRKGKSDSKQLAFAVQTQAQVGRMLNVSTASVQRWMTIGCPGKEGHYEVVPAIVHWLTKEGPWKTRRRGTDDADPLLSEAIDTPALERYRTARAKMVELEYEKACRTVMPVEDVREAFAGAAGHLRKLGESLAKQFGPAAQQMLNDGIDEYAQIIAAKFGDSERSAPVAGDDAAGTDQDGDSADGPLDEPVGGRGNLDPDGAEVGAVSSLESSGQPDLVPGTGQRPMVANGSGGPDPERQDSDGVRDPSPVPPV